MDCPLLASRRDVDLKRLPGAGFIALFNNTSLLGLNNNKPMAGKKLGPRPDDFDEVSIRNSPTFQKWLALSPGKELLYASRSFVRGGVDDEERLMRRIMIRRRVNLREHDCLKLARKEVKVAQQTACSSSTAASTACSTSTAASASSSSSGRESSNQEVDDDEMEMNMEAVTSTRSYRRWTLIPPGTSFVYNHTYIKGKDGQDWLLRKNIWRRMKYRRMNQCKVLKLKQQQQKQQKQQQPLREGRSQRRRRDDTIVKNSQEKGAVSRGAVEEDAAAATAAATFDHAEINDNAPAAASALGLPLLPPISGYEHVQRDDWLGNTSVVAEATAGRGGSEAEILERCEV